MSGFCEDKIVGKKRYNIFRSIFVKNISHLDEIKNKKSKTTFKKNLSNFLSVAISLFQYLHKQKHIIWI